MSALRVARAVLIGVVLAVAGCALYDALTTSGMRQVALLAGAFVVARLAWRLFATSDFASRT